MPRIQGVPEAARISGFLVNFHVLRDDDALYLIDAGFWGGRRALEKGLREAGWGQLPVAGILVSHGHADHIWNVGRLARETGAWIAGSPLDAARFAGEPQLQVESGPGRALARGEGALFGSPAFEPFRLDRELAEGDRLEICGGLRVVALPGHTAGHLGFFSERHGVLFSGDLFASYGGGFCHLPPAIFNEASHEEILSGSVAKVLAMGCRGLVPNHGDGAAPEVHLRRLGEMVGRDGRRGDVRRKT